MSRIFTKTYGCPNCTYYQTINPADTQVMAQNFPECPDLPAGKCPACWMGKNPQRQKLSSDMALLLEPKTSTFVSSDAELESQEEEDTDTNGQPIMVESGQYREKLINDNGTPRFIQEPVMTPKMRPIDKTRVDALKLQRNQSLDRLENIAVKEVSKDS